MATTACRHRTLERVLRLEDRCRGMRRWPDLHALAAEFGVSHRTIRRDLESLQAVGRLPQLKRYNSN